jgi:hypothetical protein
VAVRGKMMTATWALNTIGLFATTVGALLIFLYLFKSPRFADEWLTHEGKRAYSKHRRLLIIGVGLLAAWLVLQYSALIVL